MNIFIVETSRDLAAQLLYIERGGMVKWNRETESAPLINDSLIDLLKFMHDPGVEQTFIIYSSIEHCGREIDVLE